MSRLRHRRTWAWGAALALIAGLTIQATAVADPGDGGQPRAAAKGKSGDVRNVGPDYNRGKKLPLAPSARRALGQDQRRTAAAMAEAQVGDSVRWLALNDYTGSIYAKYYTLRGIGDHIEVWVADDRAFPSGDCRNSLGLTEVTDAQVQNFVTEFDTNIYPLESAAFSVAPDRDGSDGIIGAGQVPSDQADNTVVLVDNVRDDNFYDPSSPNGQTYIAGFFYSVFNEYTDRNVMTIDVFDWLHRTGANPPDDRTDPAYIACAQSQGQTRPYGAPRPHLYEGVFAHEYQHLLEYYEDGDEESWINEGLSDWAQTLVGYVNPAIPPDQPGADGHIACFLGFADPKFGGPENSLTEWSDQGAPEILCDYGAAYTFMEYLHSHYGTAFMSALHREDANGLDGLNSVLARFSRGSAHGPQGSKPYVDAQELLHRWAATMALDAALDAHRKFKGGRRNDYTASSLSAKINWDNPQAYESPGAPPNGSDYVRLRDGAGNYLSAGQLHSISFDGATTLRPEPVEWSVDSTPPDQTDADMTCGSTSDGVGPAALYSGCGENLDRSLVRQVSVPAGGANLTFDALWDTEEAWDFGFVQVSDDGGETWHSLATQHTTSDHDPDAAANIVANLPGFTGDSGAWQSESADLSPYAGKDVLVGFRYMTDPAANEAGMWVRNIQVGATELPSDSLDGWQTITQVNPMPVAGWTVQLIAYDANGRSWIHRLAIGPDFHGTLSAARLRRAVGGKAQTVAAIVMYDDPTESATQQAMYTLKANGVTQPGGS